MGNLSEEQKRSILIAVPIALVIVILNLVTDMGILEAAIIGAILGGVLGGLGYYVLGRNNQSDDTEA